jgi:hypothetical protein
VTGPLARVLEVLGFTPTQREAHLRRMLRQESAAVDDYRRTVDRVERLLAYRESLGAQTVDTRSLRGALSGEDESR